MTTASWRFALVTCLLIATACGGSTAAGPEGLAYERTELLSWQVFRVTSGTATGTQTWQVIDADATGFTRRLVSSFSVNGSDTRYLVAGGSLRLATIQECDDLGAPLGPAISFDPPALVLPARVAPGTRASGESIVTSSHPDLFQSRQLVVNGVELVTVPAGTFEALKVTTTISNFGSSFTQTNVTWWVAGAGQVRAESTLNTATPITTVYELLDRGVGPLRLASTRDPAAAPPSPSSGP